ncbi:MAG: nicotinate (nicotinamide) nucleotide adenylyltransferase [Myxococcales bacterium]
MSDGAAVAAGSRPQIAVFGGSFDPPHLGHVYLAAYALSVEHVERVLVLPVFQHAFGKPLSPFAERVEMCRLAFRDLRRVEVSELERELGGVSRTLRLVETLAASHPHHALRLLVGTDILAESAHWQGFEEITKRAPLLVAQRGGHLAKAAPYQGPVLPEISSTDVRLALARGEEPIDRVPSAVVHYAREHGLYGGGGAPP